MIPVLISYMSMQWQRLQALREDDRGMTTETLIITGTLAAAAVAVLVLIVNSINNRTTQVTDSLDP
jgi:hypothetical protein